MTTRLFITGDPMPSHAFLTLGQTSLHDAASTQDTDRIVSWSSGLPIEEYRKRPGRENAVCLPWDEAVLELEKAQRAKYCTGVEEITGERYSEMLNMLPPMKRAVVDGMGTFYFMEHLSAGLVYWFARDGDTQRCFQVVEDYETPNATIAALCRAFMARTACPSVAMGVGHAWTPCVEQPTVGSTHMRCTACQIAGIRAHYAHHIVPVDALPTSTAPAAPAPAP